MLVQKAVKIGMVWAYDVWPEGRPSETVRVRSPEAIDELRRYYDGAYGYHLVATHPSQAHSWYCERCRASGPHIHHEGPTDVGRWVGPDCGLRPHWMQR